MMNRPFVFVLVLTLGLVPARGQRASQGVLDPAGGRTAEDLVALALTRNAEFLAGRQLVASGSRSAVRS